MRKLLLAAILTALSAPAYAEWETTHFLPIPNIGEDANIIIKGNFSSFLEPIPGQTSRDNLEYSSLDMGALRRGAPAALISLMQTLSYDAKQMSIADFPNPDLAPLLTSQSGERHYPIFWSPFREEKSKKADAQQFCDVDGTRSLG